MDDNHDELQLILRRLELKGWALRLSCEPPLGWEVSARVEHNAYTCSCHTNLLEAARGLEEQLFSRLPPPPYVAPKSVPIKPRIDPESFL